ncbi:Hypothetical protein, putative [Bodo saltans]|uniref:Uncharacterized protein n=1 Tax=Bodo saltans TaxID=75058 RepID=A0A0S4J0C5_BODSA|nr:Hypothetical protein, putative [Bodo saltans]|eukprot:CUG75584.1 Hypothetical protein, putative [Bodo saltans]
MRRLLSSTYFSGARAITLGIALSTSNVAANVSDVMKPSATSWNALDTVARQRLSVLTRSDAPLTGIASRVAKQSAVKVLDGKAFSTINFKTIEEVLLAYEEILLHARRAKVEYDALELESFHIKDDLKRGLSAFKQAHLDKSKSRLDVVKKELIVKKSFIRSVGEQYFTTAVFNDIVNVLRIAGETNEDGRIVATRILDDMTLLEVPFDAQTKLLLKNILFGDGPFEDSSLLFSCVEYPERGELTVAGNRTLEEIADEALFTIGNRHQTPVDDGKLFRQNDTHPCLQRSAE